MKVSFHNKLLVLSFLFLLFSFGMNRTTLVNLKSPSLITLVEPKRGFVPYDSFNYFEDMKLLLGESDGSGYLYRQVRLLYPALSTLPYFFMREINAMLVVPFISSIVAIHFLDRILEKSRFPKEDRLISVLFLLSSHIFAYYTYTALPKTLGIAVGLWFVKEWIFGASNLKLLMLGLMSIFATPLATIFPLSCFLVSYLKGDKLSGRGPVILPFLVLLPLVGLIFFESAVLWSSTYNAENTLLSFLIRLAYFPKGVYQSLGTVSLFSLTGIYAELKKGRRSIVSEIFLFSLLLTSIFVVFWPGTYWDRSGAMSCWIVAIPGAVYFTASFLRRIKREFKIALSVAFLVLAEPYSHTSELIFATVRLLRVYLNV